MEFPISIIKYPENSTKEIRFERSHQEAHQGISKLQVEPHVGLEV